MDELPEFDDDQLRLIAAELTADETFKREISNFIRDETDQVRKDLRRLLHIPADRRVDDEELIAEIGLKYMVARALVRAYEDKEGVA